MIVEALCDSGKLAREITHTRYKQSDRIKLSKNDFLHLAHSMHLSGKLNVAESLLRSHKNNPYLSVDELLGDLQVILVQSWNEFKTVNQSQVSKMTVDELIKELDNG